MSVQGINFTSTLLDKKNVVSVTEENKATTPQNLKEKPDEFVSSAEEKEVPKKSSNKVRNWAIGIGSAATLVGLFFAGRAGKLGKGIQKFLGGAKKEVEEVAGHSKPRVTETEEEISIEEFERIKNKDADFVVGGDKKPTVTTADEIKAPKTEEKPKIEEKPAAKAEEPKPVAETPKLTPKQVELNAKLDRVPPYIDPNLLRHEFPTPERLYKHLGIDMKELEKIDISKYEKFGNDQIKYEMKLPNGNTLTIHRNNDNLKEICSVYVDGEKGQIGKLYRCTDKKESYYGDFSISFNYDNNRKINYWYEKSGTKDHIYYKHNDGKQFKYNQEGNLCEIEEPANSVTNISRKIELKDGKIYGINYSDAKEYKYLKTDYYDENGKIIDEIFNI